MTFLPKKWKGFFYLQAKSLFRSIYFFNPFPSNKKNRDELMKKSSSPRSFTRIIPTYVGNTFTLQLNLKKVNMDTSRENMTKCPEKLVVKIGPKVKEK